MIVSPSTFWQRQLAFCLQRHLEIDFLGNWLLEVFAKITFPSCSAKEVSAFLMQLLPGSTRERALFHLKQDLDPMHQDKDGRTLFHVLAESVFTDALQALFLKLKSNQMEIVNTPDLQGKTPFGEAMRAGHAEVARALLEAGANPFLDSAITIGFDLGVDLLAKDPEKWTPEYIALGNQICRLAQEKGLQIKGTLWLHMLVRGGNIAEAQGLLGQMHITKEDNVLFLFNRPEFSNLVLNLHGEVLFLNRAVIQNHWKEGAPIGLEDMLAFKNMLRFIYSGSKKEVTINHDTFKGLFKVANIFSCQALLDCLKAWLIEHPECAHWSERYFERGNVSKRKPETIA